MFSPIPHHLLSKPSHVDPALRMHTESQASPEWEQPICYISPNAHLKAWHGEKLSLHAFSFFKIVRSSTSQNYSTEKMMLLIIELEALNWGVSSTNDLVLML